MGGWTGKDGGSCRILLRVEHTDEEEGGKGIL